MNQQLSDDQQDRIWSLVHGLTTARHNLVSRQRIGMVAADLIAICCHLVQQDDVQAAAAKKLLRTLLSAYDQNGIKTACNLLLQKLDSNPAEIASLAAPHLEITRAFPVAGEGDE